MGGLARHDPLQKMKRKSCPLKDLFWWMVKMGLMVKGKVGELNAVGHH